MSGMDPASTRWEQRTDTFLVSKSGGWRPAAGSRRLQGREIYDFAASGDTNSTNSTGGANVKIAVVVLVVGFLALVLWKCCRRKRTTLDGENKARVRTGAARDEAEGAVDLEQGGSPEVVVVVPNAAESASAPMLEEGDAAAVVLPTTVPLATEVSRAADIEEGGAPTTPPFPADVQGKDDKRSVNEQRTELGAAASPGAECTVEPVPAATAAAPPPSDDIDQTPRRRGLQKRLRALAQRRATLETGAAEASRREGEAQEKIDELSALQAAATNRLNHDRAVGEARQDELRSQLRAERASDHSESLERAEIEEWESRALRAEQHASEPEHAIAEQEHEAVVLENLLSEEQHDGEKGDEHGAAAGPAPAEVDHAEAMGLARSAGTAAEGSIQELFVANSIEETGIAEMATTVKHVMGVVSHDRERLTVHRGLGQGKCGKVEEVEFADFPEEYFALKTVAKGADEYTKHAALVEMMVFARLAGQPHDNVLGALAVDDSSPLMPIMMPKATDDLETRMNNDSLAIGDKLRQVLTAISVLVVDLARATRHLHGMNIVHRDIKPGNLLVFETEELGLHGKLADFGFAREIGESCPAMMGTPGYMAFESMSRGPVAGAAGQDVVGVAMVLLMVCLRKELRSPNLYANMALINSDEMTRLKELFQRMTLGEDISAEKELAQIDMTKRTMADGSFAAMMLSADKLDPTLKSPEMLLESLPHFLAADPTERKDMGSLLDLAQSLAEINQDV
ncbi:unnamed protein product [Ectocarpus sp. CCAP 1310/34]|nr:unnamed protein product [Ectocarpus sp. CCAP 1310/34]